MELADTITGIILLGGTFFIFTIINYRILFMRLKKVERIPSPAPLIGGIAGAMLVLCFVDSTHPMLLVIPLLIDPGSIPLVVWFLICVIKDFKGNETV